MPASPASFDDLVAAHGAEVARVCRSILRDEHLGADAAQETFLRLWRRARDGERIERAGGWLRRAAVRVSIDLARRRSARAGSTPAAEADVESVGDAGAALPVEQLERAELRRRFEHALQELPEGQRTVFLLRHDGGLALADVADALGVEAATVKTQFARACLALQAKLRGFRPEDDR